MTRLIAIAILEFAVLVGALSCVRGERYTYEPALCEALDGQTTVGRTEYRSVRGGWVVTDSRDCLIKPNK